METPVKKKAFSWSYSALTNFESCPHKHFKTRIERSVDDPMGEAALWGDRCHKALEAYVKNQVPLPEGMEEFQKYPDKILASAGNNKVEAEQKMCLTREMKPTTFFSKDAYVRCIIDGNFEKLDKAFVFDYKTGKKNPDSMQLQLSAAMIMEARPWINEVTNAFIWLKSDELTVEKFTRDDLPKIWQAFLPRAQRMEYMIKEGNFPKRSSGLCRAHCPVKSCEFNGRYGEK